MNQILAITNKTEKRRNNSTVDLKKIIMFFCVAIIVFGVILIINGIVGLNKGKKDKQNGFDPSVEVPGYVETPEPNENEDREPPAIDLILVQNERIKVKVTDDKGIDYVEVYRNDELYDTINAEEDQKDLETSIDIQPGKNLIKVIAVDRTEKRQEKVQEIQGKIRPTIELGRLADGEGGVLITAECEDGISRLTYKLNGEWTGLLFDEYPDFTKEEWASTGAILEYSSDGKIIKVQYTEKNLQPGTNTFEVYAYSLTGLPGEKTQITEN